MWGHMEGYGWGGMLLFWGILIAAFALLVRNCFGTCSGYARKNARANGRRAVMSNEHEYKGVFND